MNRIVNLSLELKSLRAWFMNHALNGLLVLLLMLCLVQSSMIYADALPLDEPAQIVKNPEKYDLMAIGKTGSGRLLVVGERGHILTSNKGGSWRQLITPLSVTLTSLDVSNENFFIAVGHGLSILRSVDKGKSWTKVIDGRGLSANFGDLARNANGSKNKRKFSRLQKEGADKPLLDILMIDDKRGLAVGAYGVLLRTIDGGLTWQGAFDLLAVGEDNHLNVIRKVGNKIWIAGERGALYRSEDNGKTFSKINTNFHSTIFTLVGNENTLLAFGIRGKAIITTDGGRSWHQANLKESNSITSSRYCEKCNAFFISDESGLIRSFRIIGGKAIDFKVITRVNFPIIDFEIINNQKIVLVGMAGVQEIKDLNLYEHSEGGLHANQ